MQQGTFVELCANPVKYLHNNSSFDRVRGEIVGNLMTITCENGESSASIDWMVIAERKDSLIKKWDKTNANGYLITEHIATNSNADSDQYDRPTPIFTPIDTNE
jgi:hypothetical protein